MVRTVSLTTEPAGGEGGEVVGADEGVGLGLHPRLVQRIDAVGVGEAVQRPGVVVVVK